uniref:Plant heme peroxidase family profile domain-containing protein n=1 Tax=Chromera velia CCMP2878 TaxID=1169474 RepID=A0A0G4G826_9ALVE|eukprot:Cvel_20685.t1-p1 / transcript=Cvel_20685.t1 / gene=Cvel_20685 / organism=Chromera_velia_CCMP2878 / gene_product=Cytochrome c peroxidase, mitochondrial, putative / transcript_product=Cytochrome c peroxidase, mitochondrial, putative / location=Cvel_scaffold1880:28840-30307(-) / protein_length=285 / sequence_SO=supercontig / SO=protein_coding / is_pseudo=false
MSAPTVSATTGAASVSDDAFKGAFGDLVQLAKEKNCGPILVRLSWHDAGTYSKEAKDGGSTGTIRHDPEKSHGANAGLDIAMRLVDPIKQKYPDMSFADFFVLAGIAGVRAMGGPLVGFRGGRVDGQEAECTPDGRLPAATLKGDGLRGIFYRMGLDDKAIVVLSGAHSVGRCHKDRSGFEGPWCEKPLVFDNCYYKNLLGKEWKFDGNQYWADPDPAEGGAEEKLMMLPSDMALIEDAEFLPMVKTYASDNARFFEAFADCFQNLHERRWVDSNAELRAVQLEG